MYFKAVFFLLCGKNPFFVFFLNTVRSLLLQYFTVLTGTELQITPATLWAFHRLFADISPRTTGRLFFFPFSSTLCHGGEWASLCARMQLSRDPGGVFFQSIAAVPPETRL